MPAKRSTALRIVSLAPSATSILCEIGAKSALVGVTQWCADVAPVNGLPKLGDCWHLKSVDEIARLRPNLVIGSVPFKTETVAKLLNHPFAFLAMNPRSLADIELDIRLLAGIIGRKPSGEQLITRMRETFQSLRAIAARKQTRPRVYCEAWPNPRISSPPWVAELVEICGGKMAVPAGQRVTDAQIASVNPDVIFLAWTATREKATPQKTYALSAWKNISAIRNRQVHVVRDDLLNTPGPPLLEGARVLARILHAAGMER
jgi:iron complex transport system substrate-binding protein